MSLDLNDAVTALNVVLTGVLGYYALVLAKTQHRTDRTRLRLELFDKRYEIFDAAGSFITHYYTETPKLTHSEVLDLLKKIAPSDFLLSKDVQEHITRLSGRVLAIGNDDQPDVLALDFDERLNRAATDFVELREVFKPYLSLKP